MTLWCHDRMNVCEYVVSEFMRSNSFIIFFMCTLCLNQCPISFSLPFTLHHSSSSSVYHPKDTDKLYVSVKHITDRSYVHIEINSKQVRLTKTLFVIFCPTKFITIIHQDRPSQIERCRRRVIVNQMHHSTDYGGFMSVLSYSAGLIIYIKVRNLWDKKKIFFFLIFERMYDGNKKGGNCPSPDWNNSNQKNWDKFIIHYSLMVWSVH